MVSEKLRPKKHAANGWGRVACDLFKYFLRLDRSLLAKQVHAAETVHE